LFPPEKFVSARKICLRQKNLFTPKKFVYGVNFTPKTTYTKLKLYKKNYTPKIRQKIGFSKKIIPEFSIAVNFRKIVKNRIDIIKGIKANF